MNYIYLAQKNSFRGIFNKKYCKHIEIGSWDNEYCGVEENICSTYPKTWILKK